MMRDIKFRGLRVDGGGWVYGDLILSPFRKHDTGAKCCYILDPYKMEYDCWEDIADQMDEFEVKSETVGQFTGLKDKEGVEIWEGDIILYDGDKYTVEWGTQEWLPNDFPLCDCEAIGNIHQQEA